MRKWTILGAVLFAAGAFADDAADFDRAARYFAKDHARSFARHADNISAESPYRPMLEYWRAVLDLRRQKPAALENLRADSVSPYIRHRAGRELAKYYLRNDAPAEFAAVAEEPCEKLLAQMRARESGREAVLALWDGEEKFQSPLCTAAYQRARRDNLLSEDDIWAKLRSLAGSGKLASARRFLRAFRPGVSYKELRRTVLRAERYIRGKHGLAKRKGRELVMIAAMAAGKKSPDTAIRRWRAFSPYFSEAENAQVWAKIAERAARRHRADAMELYRLAALSAHDSSARAWRVRAALRAGDYPDVIRTVQHMPESQASLSAWRYWRAAALAHTGNRAESQAQMRGIAADTDDYYGLLAREDLDISLTLAAAKAPAAEARGDFAMALAARRAGQNRLARRIWKHASAHSNAEDTLAAARVAENEKWYLASINAANAADSPAAHGIRYPTPAPYRATIDKHIEKFGLDPAFVYALIRRESRFMPKAVSSAKARGLMQIIPSTARRVARSRGYGRYRLSRLTRVDTNTIIGMAYLDDLARRFNAHPVQVAAAYNAGPGRAARWRRNNNDTLVLVENIPFLETRLYVKALLAARAHYAARFGAPPLPMRMLAELAMTAAPQTALAE
ncbi:MAG: transglycosylase SLT domain-containing protein [Gammaproteobacteria bacterium]